jgi:Leucine-rich repeat (LRR) protein
MKATFITLLAFSLCLSLVGADKKPLTKAESPKVIEAAIRKAAKKSTGELTKADLEKITALDLRGNKLTDVKGLEKLTHLKELHLDDNQLTNVKGLEKLTNLTELFLQYNQLTDVKGLEKLTQLEYLGQPRPHHGSDCRTGKGVAELRILRRRRVVKLIPSHENP